MPLTADETRIARQLLGWSQERLAGMSGVPFGTIVAFEQTGLIRQAAEGRVRAVLQAAGIELERNPVGSGSSVRFRPSLRYHSV